MKSILPLVCLLLACVSARANDVINPDFVYFTQGQTPGTWQWVLADPGNWWQPIPDSGGASAKGKVRLENAGDESFPGAIKLKWSKSSDWGSVSLSGAPVNLAKYEHAAELVLAVKVMTKVPDTVDLMMHCGEGCEAKVNIAANLKQGPRKQWFALPLALDCFTANGLDLTKLSGPFSLGTGGKFELHIAEISLATLAEGDQGCVPNP